MKGLPVNNTMRTDLQEIARLIKPQSRVLDIGAGDGTLLAYLKQKKDIKGRGIERKQSRVSECLAKGLSVIQGNAEDELCEYPDNSFDYVVLSRTLPATHNPVDMIRQILRIGRCGIISMPNFGYWRVRLHLLFRGTMPITTSLDAPWYDTENIHLCTIKDFHQLTQKMNITIEQCYAITGNDIRVFKPNSRYINMMAEEAVFMIRDRF
ncbi:MAG: methionine biosynthesis protein MetW [Dasania sp.]|jgi:methionine biosynthesis protein MetW